jgi:GntR family transcriptional regulator
MRTPNYRRLVEDIERQIADGELVPGAQLPSGRQLQQQYGVGNNAVAQAMMLLREKGLVESHQGKGVFVAVQPAPEEQE